MGLQDRLDARNEANRDRLPAAATRAMEADVEAVRAAGTADRALALGARLPDFSLPDARGATVTRDELLADGPIVLTVFRGGWCPYCNLEFTALLDRLSDIEAAGGRLVGLSPMTPDASLTTAERLSLPFTLLSDVGNDYARRLGLVHTVSEAVHALYDGWGFATDEATGGHGRDMPLPATFVVGSDATVRWRFVDADYRRRAEPDDIVVALEQMVS